MHITMFCLYALLINIITHTTAKKVITKCEIFVHCYYLCTAIFSHRLKALHSQMLPCRQNTSHKSDSYTEYKSDRNHRAEQLLLAHKCKQCRYNLESSCHICQYLVIHIIQKNQRYRRSHSSYDDTLYDERRPYEHICRSYELHDPDLFLAHRDSYRDSVA